MEALQIFCQQYLEDKRGEVREESGDERCREIKKNVKKRIFCQPYINSLMNDDDRGPNHSKPQIEVLDVSVVDLFIVGL